MMKVIDAKSDLKPKPNMKLYRWLIGGASLACAVISVAQETSAPAPNSEAVAAPVTTEEADEAAFALADSLDFGGEEEAQPVNAEMTTSGSSEEESSSETTIQDSPPDRSKQKMTGNPVGAPAALTDEDFKELNSSSPFTRSLNLSDSLILTGVAKIGNETMATLIDKNTNETYVVSGQTNAQGWRMVDLEGDANNLEGLTAKIAVSGGEVVSVRFDEKRLKPGEGKPAAGVGGGGGPGDGRGKGMKGRGGGGPNPELREKIMKLSEEQRGKLFEKLREIREANPNLSREEMGAKLSSMTDKLLKK